MKNYQLAEHHYSKGVEIAEEIRSTLLVSERKNFFAAKISGFLRSEPAKGLVRISVKQKRPERSIYPSEVVRAREFADNLSQKVEGQYFDVPAELIEQEAALTNKLASLKTALPIVPKALDSQRYAELTNQIRNAEVERQRFVKVLCQQYGDYCAVKHPTPVHLEQADIGPDEHILLFNCLGDGVAIQLLKGKKIVKSSFLEWNSQEMEREIRRFREPFEQIQLSKFRLNLARSFHERLTADVLQSVPTGAPITVIPDGALALLPFEALITGGVPSWTTGAYGEFPSRDQLLGRPEPNHLLSISYRYDASSQACESGTNGWTVLVMADPIFEMTDERVRNSESPKPAAENKDHPSRVKSAIEQSCAGALKLRRLPQTRELGDSLKGLYGDSCEVYTGFQCTKKAFLDRVSKRPNRYGSIVFGTHGFAANDLPGVMEPVLALSMVPEGTDGFLTMTEIAGLKMNADIVALTACKTGLGARLEGVAARAFAGRRGNEARITPSSRAGRRRPRFVVSGAGRGPFVTGEEPRAPGPSAGRAASPPSGPGEVHRDRTPASTRSMMRGAPIAILEPRITLIDAGLAGSHGRIERGLRGSVGRSTTCARIVCTHGHPDHAGGVAELAAPGTEVCMHPADVEGLQTRRPRRAPPAHRGAGSSRRSPGPRRASPVEDGDVLPVLGGLRVIHTPGHTPGSICLYAPRDRLLFVGDVLQCRCGRVGFASRLYSDDYARRAAASDASPTSTSGRSSSATTRRSRGGANETSRCSHATRA